MGEDMSFRLKSKDATVADGVRRVARSQMAAAIAEIDDASLDRAVVVHQVRKRCKKMRGLLRLVRPTFEGYETENARFRDAANTLSATRDADVLVDTYDALEEHFGRRFDSLAFQGVRERLLAERDAAHGADDTLAEKLAAFRAVMEEAHAAAKKWQLDGHGADTLRKGIARTMKGGKKALKAAHRRPANTETMHELRKRAKDTWYQVRLMRDLWPGPMEALAVELSNLADLLGAEHDTAVFQDRLKALIEEGFDAETGNALDKLAIERRRRLQAAAITLADRVFAGDPKAEAARMVGLWKAWRRAPEPIPTLGTPAPQPEDGGKPDHVEIERKFLVTGEGWRSAVRRTLHIRQGYLCHTDTVSVRVRIADDREAVLTVKTAAPALARTEVEVPVPLSEAHVLMGLVTGHVARKDRHMVTLGAHRIAIDEYLGPDSGIVLAEIELDDTETAPPKADWLGKEVTGDTRYYAATIAATENA